MNTVAKLTQKQIEKLAVEIRTFLLEHDMWVDTQIYFNGKCFDTHDKETGEFYYNDPEHLVVREKCYTDEGICPRAEWCDKTRKGEFAATALAGFFFLVVLVMLAPGMIALKLLDWVYGKLYWRES